ncbi:MAG: sigma-70 family RNA polymerase sigma factor [Deltaproteobacteria bacterium]|nr:sigma-70 family RNA polymerase sigma factor [Deltaproteobacteria bacterium]MBN2670674.1 sigma-70 family RNA polymerase sigma factor [Deltaproteobacteria bacterium]
MTEIPLSLADLQLVRQALEDPKNEEAVLTRLYPRIVQIVKFVAGNRSHVDDIAQIAAMEVLKSLKWFKGTGSLEAWASRIAYRTAMKVLKRSRKPEVVHMPLLDEDVITRETPEKSISRRQLFESLVDKLSVIPEKRRVPLLLHLAYGYTVREVAEMTDVSQNTVKDRLKTAFREFRAILDDHPNLVTTMLEEL